MIHGNYTPVWKVCRYPAYGMFSSGLLVLFTAYGVGGVVKATSMWNCYPKGYYSTTWQMDRARPLAGVGGKFMGYAPSKNDLDGITCTFF